MSSEISSPSMLIRSPSEAASDRLKTAVNLFPDQQTIGILSEMVGYVSYTQAW